MRTTFGFILVLLTATACTSTKHQLVPRYGFDFQVGERLVIAQFQSRSTLSTYATEQLLGAFHQCPDVEIVPPDTVHNFFYRNMLNVNPIWEVDIPMMVRIRQATQARYLLIGKFLDESSSRPPVSIATRYANGYQDDIHENYSRVQFLLYDLATHRTVLSLQTRTKANQYNYQGEDGATSFFAPANLTKTVVDKGVKKLADSCGCD
ncbi:hypothetical protein [Tunicatimonas pelagia]|uniref:hypothetical protein n=1 Tax=Tunicatimonas pelagia TaxID=931531 RepID=UPI00266536A1|nr:hypothetical protein [Tunicatimonas pelagia]WKN45115.1 hypothetical protein P0M28_09080 [Tunicatimonas pelagia]